MGCLRRLTRSAATGARYDGDIGPELERHFEVTHRYGDGAVALAAKVLSAVGEIPESMEES